MIILFFILKNIKRLLLKNRRSVGVIFIASFFVNYLAICIFDLAKIIITLENYITTTDISQILKLLILIGIFAYLNKALLPTKASIFTVLGSSILFNIYYAF